MLYTERHDFDEPEFQCANVRDMIRYLNGLGPELSQGTPDPEKHLPSQIKTQSKAPRRKEAER